MVFANRKKNDGEGGLDSMDDMLYARLPGRRRCSKDGGKTQREKFKSTYLPILISKKYNRIDNRETEFVSDIELESPLNTGIVNEHSMSEMIEIL